LLGPVVLTGRRERQPWPKTVLVALQLWISCARAGQDPRAVGSEAEVVGGALVVVC
jgi:hypothetical protein